METFTQLKNIPQWMGFLKQLQEENCPLSDLKTLLFGGYFYNFTSPVPTMKKLEAALNTAVSLNADMLMLPTVRNNVGSEILRENGFHKIPFYLESIFKIEGGSVEDTLVKSVGRKQFRYMRNSMLRAKEHYHFSFHASQELLEKPELLKTAAHLHHMNASKYAHAINYYNEDSLKGILESPIGQNFYVGLRQCKTSLKPIQVCLLFIEPKFSHIYFLAQGIAVEQQKAPANLYLAIFFEIYLLAESLGIQAVQLGRGGHINKRKMGANHFFLLNNWIKTANNSTESALLKLTTKAEHFWNTEIENLFKSSVTVL